VPEPALLLTMLNFALIGLLPRIFFRGDGVLNARWWATATPFGIVPVYLVVARILGLDPITPTSWTRPLALVAVLLSAASIGLICLTLGTHRIRIALWHQDNDAPANIVTYGAYRWIRHPFYTSFLLAFLAAVALHPDPVTLAGLAYGIVALSLTARREERRLAASAFGAEYRQYLARTGRFLPRLGGARAAGAPAVSGVDGAPAAADSGAAR
jgi:protein-S-isoprenylcysteine O-methyltransferase Ste14